MSFTAVDKIADAILYEGYVLYPYRPSSIKNRQRWNFGSLSPKSYSDAQGGAERSISQTQCLVLATDKTSVNVRARFLHLTDRQAAEPAHSFVEATATSADFLPVAALRIGSRVLPTWQEAVEREFSTPSMQLSSLSGAQRHAFQFPASEALEILRGETGEIGGAFIRRQNELRGAIDCEVEHLGHSLFRLTVKLVNLTPFANTNGISRDEAMMFALVSSHLILHVDNGEFVSLLEPPADLQDAASQCKNIGCYPVLVGDTGERRTMLSSPVILYDYPQIAPESPGNLFDGTEIDEILALRIMTLTPEEKDEMRDSDERTRAVLSRVESHPEHLAGLHGTMRPERPSRKDNV